MDRKSLIVVIWVALALTVLAMWIVSEEECVDYRGQMHEPNEVAMYPKGVVSQKGMMRAPEKELSQEEGLIILLRDFAVFPNERRCVELLERLDRLGISANDLARFDGMFKVWIKENK